MEEFEAIWKLARSSIIKKALLHVGLTSVSPVGRVIAHLTGKFLDKFVKPEYHKTVAYHKEEYRRLLEKYKLERIDDAIENEDRDDAIDAIDDLR